MTSLWLWNMRLPGLSPPAVLTRKSANLLVGLLLLLVCSLCPWFPRCFCAYLRISVAGLGRLLSYTARLWALPPGLRPPFGQRWGRGCSLFPVTSVVPAKRGTLSPALGAAQFHLHVGDRTKLLMRPFIKVE